METGSAHSVLESGLVARVRNMLLRPGPEWDRIDAEPTTIGQLYRGYVLPLAAIPAVSGLLGSLVFGFSALGLTYRPTVGGALVSAALQYVLTLAGVYIMALVIDAMAPLFRGTRNRIQAFKVAAYSATAAWVAAIFTLLPPISLLSILGFYSFYLLYVGLPRLMKAPRQNARLYTLAAIIVAFAIWLVIAALTAPFARLFDHRRAPESYQISVDAGQTPGEQSLAGQADAATDAQATADPARLEELLPQVFAGLERTELETTAGGGEGEAFGAAAIARYAGNDASASIQITDMAAMSGYAALGSALNIASNHTTDGSYERMGKIDGRMYAETWDRHTGRASYSIVVADRFVVTASSEGMDMNSLKAALSRIDLDALERLATG